MEIDACAYGTYELNQCEVNYACTICVHVKLTQLYAMYLRPTYNYYTIIAV